MKAMYFEVIALIERLHRLLFDVLKAELDYLKISDITNIQCYILYNIGHETLSVGELTNRGYYLGSNVTYNLKKMVENDYLIQERSAFDKRSSHVRLSKKGLKLYEILDKTFQTQSDNLRPNGIDEKTLASLGRNLKQIEHFWSFALTRRS